MINTQISPVSQYNELRDHIFSIYFLFFQQNSFCQSSYRSRRLKMELTVTHTIIFNFYTRFNSTNSYSQPKIFVLIRKLK